MIATDTVTMFGFRLTAVGLEPVGTPTFQQYQDLGEYLKFVEGALPFWVGDWVRYGETLYGERASQAAAYAGVKVDTVKQYAWVADRVAPPVRDPDLSFSHHREVASLPPVEQRRWLKQAKAGDDGTPWPVEKMRRQIKAASTPAPEQERTIWVLVACRGSEDAERLIEQQQREGRVAKVTG